MLIQPRLRKSPLTAAFNARGGKFTFTNLPGEGGTEPAGNKQPELTRLLPCCYNPCLFPRQWSGYWPRSDTSLRTTSAISIDADEL